MMKTNLEIPNDLNDALRNAGWDIKNLPNIRETSDWNLVAGFTPQQIVQMKNILFPAITSAASSEIPSNSLEYARAVTIEDFENFKEEFTEKLRILGSFAATTNSDFAENLRVIGDLMHDPGFDDQLTALAESFEDKFIARNNWKSYFPDSPCGEEDAEISSREGRRTTVKGTQSYLTDLNTRIRDPNAQLHHIGVEKSSEVDVLIPLDLNSIPEDRYESVSFLNIKPAVVGYVRGKSGPNAITLFGDAKPFQGIEFPFTEQQIGQILGMAFEFLRQVQPWRLFIIVFLTDTRRWQFFKVSRNPRMKSGFETLESTVQVDMTGWATYIALLCACYNQLGYSDKSIDGVEDMQLISAGKKYVFKGKLLPYGKIVVLKVFPRGLEYEFETERRNLARLSRLTSWREHVPTIVLDSLVSKSNDRVLAVTPLGVPVRPCRDGQAVLGKHIVQLIGVIEEVHTATGLAHRDIKPSNILFSADDDRLILIDWGSAAEIGELTMFQGTVGFYDVPYEEFHIPTAEADLVAVLRSAYLMIFNEMPPASTHYDIINAFWRARLNTPILQDALRACYRRDYKALAAELSKIK